jgi:spore coat polysaccharide biosynthesis protein SpsF (cytidylyltransferase family)
MTAQNSIRAFIQARMSSKRFPGKVLAPFAGRPLIDHVLQRVAQTVPAKHITVLTSSHPSDDPLDGFLAKRGVHVLRGSLDDVFDRFRSGLAACPCDYFFRVCADSPLLDPCLLGAAAQWVGRHEVDLVTNVHPRTYPRGQSVELLRTTTFLGIDTACLTAAEREHVTAIYYAEPARFRIHNLDSGDPGLAGESLAVDTMDDLRRLEFWLRSPGEVPSRLSRFLETSP